MASRARRGQQGEGRRWGSGDEKQEEEEDGGVRRQGRQEALRERKRGRGETWKEGEGNGNRNGGDPGKGRQKDGRYEMTGEGTVAPHRPHMPSRLGNGAPCMPYKEAARVRVRTVKQRMGKKRRDDNGMRKRMERERKRRE